MTEESLTSEKEYNPEKLHAELNAAGLPVSGVTSAGRIDWPEKPSADMLAQAESVKAAHVALTEAELFEQACRRSGINTQTLLRALWQKVAENDPAEVDLLQARMREIRDKLASDAGV